MSDPVWYRSLYWRIALGFVLCLTGLLVAQALLFLWLAERSAASMLARSPQHLAAVIASDLSDALEANDQLDLQRTLHDQYSSRPDRIIVVLRDGRVFQNDTSTPPPDWALRAARSRLQYHRFTDAERAPEVGARDGERERGTAGVPIPLPMQIQRRLAGSPIQVRGDMVGVVMIIPARRPPYP